jgi:hypothetical protein
MFPISLYTKNSKVMLINRYAIEKVRIKAPQSAVIEVEGIKDKNAITKLDMAMARINDIPLDPVSIF